MITFVGAREPILYLKWERKGYESEEEEEEEEEEEVKKKGWLALVL